MTHLINSHHLLASVQVDACIHDMTETNIRTFAYSFTYGNIFYSLSSPFILYVLHMNSICITQSIFLPIILSSPVHPNLKTVPRVNR